MIVFLKWFGILILGLIIVVFVANYIVEKQTNSSVYSSISDIPHNRVGVLLGTSKHTNNGRINLFFKYRIDAAVTLFKAKKIDYIVVSGDNRQVNYNEPVQMQEALMSFGVPKNRIVLDYAGFRTLDSVVRAKKVFGQSKITFISQKFHNQRAIFIAKYKSMDAIGFNAKDLSFSWSYKTIFREKLARVKVILDLIFGVEPKFLGEKVVI